jgi:beta-glucanase (GH16 family)
MSLSFRLRYLLGLIPSAAKIDSEWGALLKMRDKLNSIQNSKEFARYNELSGLIQSSEFQLQKNDIKSLKYAGSPESQNIQELARLEKTGPIKSYFSVLHSPQLERFQKISQSKALSRYQELKSVVESSDFQLRKKEMESLRYKGSPEYQKRQEYISLSRNRKLNQYFKTIESSEYLQFKEFDSSERRKVLEHDAAEIKKDPQMKRYLKFQNSGRYRNIKYVESIGLASKLEQLKEEINAKSFLEREAFLKDAKRYESSKDYPNFKEYSQLIKNEDIQFYRKFKDSQGYRNYEKVRDSWELKRLNELREITNEAEFKKRVAYLKDKKRYDSTDHYKKEQEFNSLDKSELMKEYRLLNKSSKLNFFNQWSVVFDEDFNENKLNTERWQPENYWGYKMAGRSFSQADEAQAFNGLNNILLNNHVLSILTKREKVTGQIWDATKGLIPKQFDYSSGIINSGDSFRFREGAIEAKVRFADDASITNAFSLTGSKPMPQVDVFRSGNGCVSFGITDQTSGTISRRYKTIKGINFNHFHVFRLEKSNNRLTWKINGYMVHSEQYTDTDGEMFLNFISSMHEPVNNSKIPHRFEIDWVRCYQEKNKTIGN